MATDSPNSAQQEHVPAWKRLGLKLKYAKETAEPAADRPKDLNSAPKENKETSRITAQDHADHERPSKKRKTSSTSRLANDSETRTSGRQSEKLTSLVKDATESQTTAARPSIETENPQTVPEQSDERSNESNAPADQPQKTPKRRKSVTFTGETKQNDGNSEKISGDPQFSQEAIEPATAIPAATQPERKSPKKAKKSGETAVDSESAKSPSSEKRENKREKKESARALSQPSRTPEYVRYLEQFHNDKASWKFNKNQQNSLLKNIFDISIIPTSLTPAAFDYISGLRGAGPLERLIESANSILRPFAERDGVQGDIDAMNTESARRHAYFEAMRRQVQKWEDAGRPQSEYDDEVLGDMAEQAERGRRAEAILSALPLSESVSQPATAASQASSTAVPLASSTSAKGASSTEASSTSDSKPTSSRKKRKKRTDVSSDSDSSSSDSDSLGPAKRTKGPLTASEALRPTPSSTTSKANTPGQRTPAYRHDNDLNMAYRPQNPSQLMSMSAKPTKKFFDDELLDQAFPETKKKKAEESSSESSSGSDSDSDSG